MVGTGRRVYVTTLTDRFDLPAPLLSQVDPPARRGLESKPKAILVNHLRTRTESERCEHGLRERRSYQEVRGTDGYKFIADAGLRDFPPLTDAQQRILVERTRVAREAARVKTNIDQIASIPGGYGVSGI